MTYRQVLKEAEVQLQNAQIEEPQADAWCLFEHCTRISRTQYFIKQSDEMPEEEKKSFLELILKRMEHIPVQHLTGVQYFCGYEFLVNRHVLIPRQDTECLVEETLKYVKAGDRILDMCTGSGCILLSTAALSGKELELAASDVSQEALKVAAANAERFAKKVSFFQGDLFENVTGSFDCIVSNPPYIATGEIAHLSPEVKDHDPYLALDGKEDGLWFYRRIVNEAKPFLKSGGWLLFEIGYDQGESVPLLMKEAGYIDIYVKKDLAGLDRVVAGRIL